VAAAAAALGVAFVVASDVAIVLLPMMLLLLPFLS
jgi:hypothetical protein